MEGGGEEGAPTASGGKSSTRTVGSERQETDQVGGAVVGKLGPGDLLVVLTELFDVRADWEVIGLALKLSPGALKAIKGPYKDPTDCMIGALTYWLNTSVASWSSLVQALRHPLVGQGNLAAELERKYLTREHTSTASLSPYQPPSLPPHRPASVRQQFPAPSHLRYPPPCYPTHHFPLPLTDYPPSVGYNTHPLPQALHVQGPSTWPWPLPHTSATPYQPPSLPPSLPPLPPHHPVFVQQQFPAPSHLPYPVPGYPAHHFPHPLTDYPPSVGYNTHPLPQAVHVHGPVFPSGQTTMPMGSYPPTNFPTEDIHPPTLHLLSPRLQPTHTSPLAQHRATHMPSLPHSRPSQATTTTAGGMHPPTAFTHPQGESGQSTAAGKPSTPDPQLGPMELFAESLMAEYERVSAACEEKLYPTPTAEYTNLAVIKKELMSRTEADKFTRSTLHGGLDEIMREKTPVNLQDVFKPDGKRQAVNYVLVEGAPGVGKSTFALELCRRWHSIALMKRFVAVVLLRLRERRVQEAKSVADLLYHDDDDIKKDVVKQVHSNSGENILLVLDGFDELPSRLQRSSFVADMICYRRLRKATVLVTSRPSARHSLLSLRPHPDKHIEVLGFTSALVEHYAKSVYGADSRLLADFRTYVDTNPAIKSMMYVPLNSAIVVEIYREYRTEGRPIPQTMTQLYTELTMVRIRSYLRDQCKQPLDSLPVALEDLPKEFRDQLLSLAELAFNGCMNEEVIFDRLPVGCTSLGLMTASQEMYVGKKGAVDYNFFHLQHQEFLAAFYVSHLTLAEKREIFLQCLDRRTLQVLDIDNPPEMSVVWRFVVALVGFEDIGWDKYMPWLGRLLGNTLPKEKEEEEEEGEVRRVTPFLAQCLYEAQEKVDWENLLETACVTFRKPHSPLDCFAVGYCVAASKWAWDLEHGDCRLGPEMVKMLACGLNSRQEINGSIRKLELSRNPIGAEGVAHLQELPDEILQGISYLGVSVCRLDSAALDLLSRLVPTMTSMKELHISGNPAGHGGTVNILKSLSTVNQLQTLSIWGINLDIMALSPLIRPSVGSVKKLVIGDQKMTREHTEMMLEAVLRPSSLQSLHLARVHFTPRVITLLQDNHNLIKLTVHDCTPGTISHIAEGLHSQTTLRELEVRYLIQKLTTDDIIPLSEMLKKNQSLKTMTLEAYFTRQDVQPLVSALQDNHTLEQLHLKYFGFRTFPELELDQSDPRVSIEGTQQTAQSAYFEAVEKGNTAVVNSLLELESVGVDDVSPDGHTALVIAAKEGHGELVECLIVHGAAVDGNNPSQTTPLFEATHRGHREVVKVLLEHGAYINKPTLLTPLKEAKDQNDIAIAKMLITQMARDAIIEGSKCCDVKALKQLERSYVELGESSFDFLDRNRCSPLIHACKEVEVSQEKRQKRQQTVEFLLEKGASALPRNESKRSSGLTAFHVACETGDLQILNMLWDSAQKQEHPGAVSLNITTADGRNMVHYACAGDESLKVLQWLFEKDLKSKEVLNAQTEDGYTPLLIACQHHRLELIKALLDGSDPQSLGTHELVEMYTSDESNRRKTGLHIAALYDSAEIAQLLLAHGCPLDIQDADGNTALHVAVKRSSVQVAHILRENKAPAELKNNEDKTPDQVEPEDVIPVEIVNRGERAIEIYKRALRSGSTKIPRVTTLLLGESRGGKSSLYRLLTGKCFVHNLDSTRGIDSNEVSGVEFRSVSVAQGLREMRGPEDQLDVLLASNVIQRLKVDGEMHVISPTCMDEHVYQEIAELVSWLQQQSDKTQSSPATDLFESNQESERQEEMPSTDQESVQQGEVPSGGVDTIPAPDKHTERQAAADPDVPKKTTTEVADQESEQRNERQPAADRVSVPDISRVAAGLIDNAFKHPQEEHQCTVYLNFLDFAGQKAYMPMHHCFIVRRAIYLVVFNLQEFIESEGNSDHSSPFNKIRYWLNSIAMHTREVGNPLHNEQLKGDGNEWSRSKEVKRIFLVGTRRAPQSSEDGVEITEMQLLDIDKRLRKEFDDKYGKDICYVNCYFSEKSSDAIFSPVESSLERSCKESGARHLCEELNMICYDNQRKLKFLNEEYPVVWLKFGMQLLSERKERSQESMVMRWKGVEELAHPLSIVEEDDLKTVVGFFHDTGTIVCLRFAELPHLFLEEGELNLIKDLLVLDPKWLMEVMKDLMELRDVNTGKIKMTADGYKHKHLQHLDKYGIAYEPLLRKCWEKYYSKEAEEPRIPTEAVTFRVVCLILQAYGLIFPVKGSLLPDQSSSCDFLVPCMLPEQEKKDLVADDIKFVFDFEDFFPEVVYDRLICLMLMRSNGDKLTSEYCDFTDITGYEPSHWRIEKVEQQLRFSVSPDDELQSVPPTDLVKVIHGFLWVICKESLPGTVYIGGPIIEKCYRDKCEWSGVLPYVIHGQTDKKRNRCPVKCCRKEYKDIDGCINPKYKPGQAAQSGRPADQSAGYLTIHNLCIVYWSTYRARKWSELGTALLRKSHNSKCLKDVLKAWLPENPSEGRTWATLLAALKEVGEKDVVEDIVDMYFGGVEPPPQATAAPFPGTSETPGLVGPGAERVGPGGAKKKSHKRKRAHSEFVCSLSHPPNVFASSLPPCPFPQPHSSESDGEHRSLEKDKRAAVNRTHRQPERRQRGHLTMDDFSAVKGKLLNINFKWNNIGLALEFNQDFLTCIGHNFSYNGDRLGGLITEWLKRAKPEATWGALVSALRDPNVGEERLAEDLAKKYLPIPDTGEHSEPSDDDDEPPSPGTTFPKASETPAVQETIQQAPKACGLAIIVSNGYEGTDCPLPDTCRDARNMEKAFGRLKFATHLEHDLGKDRLEELAAEAARCTYPQSYRCIAFVFSGHGKDADHIIASDKKLVNTPLLIEQFLPEKARKIAKIPKLFFFDACRGAQKMEGLLIPKGMKDVGTMTYPKGGNYLVAYSNLPGYVSYEARRRGGLWMTILAEHLGKKDVHICTTLAEVNKDLIKRYQTTRGGKAIMQPELKTTLNDVVNLKALADGEDPQPQRAAPPPAAPQPVISETAAQVQPPPAPTPQEEALNGVDPDTQPQVVAPPPAAPQPVISETPGPPPAQPTNRKPGSTHQHFTNNPTQVQPPPAPTPQEEALTARGERRERGNGVQRPNWVLVMVLVGIFLAVVIGALIQIWSSVARFWTGASP